MRSPPQILLIGHDASLLDTRRWLLQGQGFRVFLATTVTDASPVFSTQDIDLLILCQSLSVQERGHALSLAQSIRPQMKRLILQATDIPYTLAALEAQEQVLAPLEGPKAFLHKIATMLNSSEPDDPRRLIRLK